MNAPDHSEISAPGTGALLSPADNPRAADAGVDPGAGGSATSHPRSLNPTRFLCRSECRIFLLEYARQKRPFNKFERVSEETLIAINEAVRAVMIARVERAPSKGKTL